MGLSKSGRQRSQSRLSRSIGRALSASTLTKKTRLPCEYQLSASRLMPLKTPSWLSSCFNPQAPNLYKMIDQLGCNLPQKFANPTRLPLHLTLSIQLLKRPISVGHQNPQHRVIHMSSAAVPVLSSRMLRSPILAKTIMQQRLQLIRRTMRSARFSNREMV